MALKSQQEIYDLFIDELQSLAPGLTDTNDGSNIDALAGATSVAISEVVQLTIDEFAKTFFDTANGPDVTGDVDDLENLAVDHFGDAFARPAASSATGEVTFSRATAAAGDCVIAAGTVVKTPIDSSGNSQRFTVDSEVTLTGTTIDASVTAVVAGTDGNIGVGELTVIETTLTDNTVTVTNAAAFGDGEDTETDTQYRETIRNLIETLRGATKAAIEAAALTVAGVQTATAFEELQYVMEWDIATGAVVPGEDYFGIPRVKLYVADANGVASASLLASVTTAVDLVRACGVRIEILSGSALTLNWTMAVTLNPSGPNYATLQTDTTMIVDTMTQYIQDLDVAESFVIATAEAYILSLWGPSGTDDLTAVATSVPSGSVAPAANQKLIPGTIQT